MNESKQGIFDFNLPVDTVCSQYSKMFLDSAKQILDDIALPIGIPAMQKSLALVLYLALHYYNTSTDFISDVINCLGNNMIQNGYSIPFASNFWDIVKKYYFKIYEYVNKRADNSGLSRSMVTFFWGDDLSEYENHGYIVLYDMALENFHADFRAFVPNTNKTTTKPQAKETPTTYKNYMPLPQQVWFKKSFWKAVGIIFVISVILCDFFPSIFNGLTSQSSSQVSETDKTTSQTSMEDTLPIEPVIEPLPYPANGEILFDAGLLRVAPLTIKTSEGFAYYLKLCNVDGEDVITFFLHPSTEITVDVPLGTYQLRYAYGSGAWYGITPLFGDKTIYETSDEWFYFTQDTEYYNGYTLTLYPVDNGNLETYEIEPEDF